MGKYEVPLSLMLPVKKVLLVMSLPFSFVIQDVTTKNFDGIPQKQLQVTMIHTIGIFIVDK